MTIPALLIGLGAAVLLLLAGYLAGLWRGLRERTRLRGAAEQQAAILERLEQRNASALDVKSSIEQALAPLVERERLSLDLARVGGAGERRDLSPLLDQVASVGNFGSVLLSNEDGLVVASAGTAPDFDAMAAATARLTGVADQFAARRGGALAIVIRDAAELDHAVPPVHDARPENGADRDIERHAAGGRGARPGAGEDRNGAGGAGAGRGVGLPHPLQKARIFFRAFTNKKPGRRPSFCWVVGAVASTPCS